MVLQRCITQTGVWQCLRQSVTACCPYASRLPCRISIFTSITYITIRELPSQLDWKTEVLKVKNKTDHILYCKSTEELRSLEPSDVMEGYLSRYCWRIIESDAKARIDAYYPWHLVPFHDAVIPFIPSTCFSLYIISHSQRVEALLQRIYICLLFLPCGHHKGKSRAPTNPFCLSWNKGAHVYQRDGVWAQYITRRRIALTQNERRLASLFTRLFLLFLLLLAG